MWNGVISVAWMGWGKPQKVSDRVADPGVKNCSQDLTSLDNRAWLCQRVGKDMACFKILFRVYLEG